MSVVPGLEWDCFISYRRLDDLGPGQVQGGGWVTHFFDDLTVSLGQWLGQPPRIFMDPKLDRDAELPPELRDTVAASAVLVPIISPGYQQSSWCPGEFAAFRERAETEGRWSIGNRLAVKKVVMTPLKNEAHQTFPVNNIGHCFFSKNVHTGKWVRYEFGSPKYNEELEDLAQETARLLDSLAELGRRAPTSVAGVMATNKEILLACDAIGFDGNAPVRLVSCVVVDQSQVLSKRMERFKVAVGQEPKFSSNVGLIERMRQRGLRYEDDETPLRDRVADELAVLPWDGHVSFADSNFWATKTEADTIMELLRGVVFDRLRGLIGDSIKLVLSPRFAPFWHNVSGAALKYRQEITAVDAVKVVGTSELYLAEPTNAAVEVANYLGWLTVTRLAAPLDAEASRRFARVYPNKLRTLHDLRTDIRYSRHKPLPVDLGVS